MVADAALEELRRCSRREVVIRWRSSADAAQEPPPFLELQHRDGESWTCLLAGTAAHLVRWASGRAIDDLSIGRPDLEALFRRYYEREGDSA